MTQFSNQFILNDEEQQTRVCDCCLEATSIAGDWVHDKLKLVLEISPYNQGYIAMPRHINSHDYAEPWILGTSLTIDAWQSMEDFNSVSLLDPNCADGKPLLKNPNFRTEQPNRLHIESLTEDTIEVSNGDLAWVFCGTGIGADPDDLPDETLSETEKEILEERNKEIAREVAALKKRVGVDPEGVLEGLPNWWGEKETEEFMRRFGEELKKKIDYKEVVKEKLTERAIEKVAAKMLAEQLAKRERDIALRKLIARGYSPDKASKIADRLSRRLYKQYLYKHPSMLKRFSVFTKFKKLKLLIKSPKVWARSAVAKALIKGLGAKLLGGLGLISDLYTIGEAIYHWHKAAEAREGAREAHRQADELDRQFKKMLEDMSPEQRRVYEERERKRKEYNRLLKQEHKKRLEERSKHTLPDIQA